MDILKEMNETDLKSLAIDKTLDRQRILNALSGSDMNSREVCKNNHSARCVFKVLLP